ncbi:MAG: 23S rRNA (adenine(2503)-C(2))-methyltransferase RlmN [Planctomycetota bacterium]
MPHLLDNLDRTLGEWADRNGLPGYRRRQVRRWLFEKRAGDWQAMSDLPKALRERLAGELPVWSAQVAKHTTAGDGTEKLLLSLAGGGQVECVLLRDGLPNALRGGQGEAPAARRPAGGPTGGSTGDSGRRTICVSSQVGCGMGCVFCASGLDGVDRNLSAGEIVEQMLLLQRRLAPEERLSHIVMMGMGEPLANLSNVLTALDEAARDDGLGISPRRITISTVGLPKAIRRLAALDARYRLAISLHAPTDELRNQIVPINHRVGIADVLAAADDYYRASRRRLTFEYVLLAGLNDRPEHAHQLTRLLAGRHALLNVIPYNPVEGLPYRTPSPAAQRAFREVLQQGGLSVRFRHRKGDKINAACGQLRRNAQATPAVVEPVTL